MKTLKETDKKTLNSQNKLSENFRNCKESGIS